MPYKDISPPAGQKITRDQQLNVPENPVIPFIRGDGTGPDIWAASERVFDAAVEKAYGGESKKTGVLIFTGGGGEKKIEKSLSARTGRGVNGNLSRVSEPIVTP